MIYILLFYTVSIDFDFDFMENLLYFFWDGK